MSLTLCEHLFSVLGVVIGRASAQTPYLQDLRKNSTYSEGARRCAPTKGGSGLNSTELPRELGSMGFQRIKTCGNGEFPIASSPAYRR
jgi:hypothetical protein